MTVNLNTKNVKTLRKQIIKFYLNARASLDGRKKTKFDNLLIYKQPQKEKLIKAYNEIIELLQAKGKIKPTDAKVAQAKQAQQNINKRIAIYGHFKTSHMYWSNDKNSKEAIDIIKYPKNLKESDIQQYIEETYRPYYEESEDYYYQQIKKLHKLTYEISSVDNTKNLSLSKIPMKSAFVLEYEWLKYADGISKKSFSDMKGRCVYELLIEHLKPRWTTVNADALFSIFNDFNETKVLDVDYQPLTMDSGVSTQMIAHLCQLKKISMYAFDIDEHCFHKVLGNDDYRPIAFYMIDGHMYQITDKSMIRSIAQTHKRSNKPLKSLRTNLLDAFEGNHIYQDVECVSCDSFDEAIQHNNKNVFLPFDNITTHTINYVIKNKYVPVITSKAAHKITGIYIKKQNLTIYCSPPTPDGISWKDVKGICQAVDIPFNNQSIGTLINQIKKQFFKPNEDLQELVKFDEMASSFNQQVSEIVQSKLFKQWAFVEKLHPEGINRKSKKIQSKLFKIDHIKCRRNLVIHNQYDYPVFSVMDSPCEYKGDKIKCGYYFVESSNYFPLRGNGWYPYHLVDFCLTNKIIQSSDIKYELLSSFRLPEDHFQDFCKFLIEITSGIDGKLSKLIINAMVGTWGISKSVVSSVKLTMNKHQAMERMNRNEKAFVLSEEVGDQVVYQIFENKEIINDDSLIPLYNHIIASEAIALYELEQLIKRNGGIPLERNTDAILYYGNQFPIENYFYDMKNTTPKYQYEQNPKPLRVESVCKFIRNQTFDYKPMLWNTIEDTNEKDNSNLVDKVIELGSCAILGRAGTGKTYLTNRVIQALEDKGLKIEKLAPTNKSARLINGMTIHKKYVDLSLSKMGKNKIIKNLQNIDYIIVDEISMVHEIFYRMFTMIKKYCPKINFIIVGDFLQFKPVCDRYTGNYSKSSAFFELCGGNKLELTKCRRADDTLFNLTNPKNISSINAKQFLTNQLFFKNVSYTHKTRKFVNAKCMNEHIKRNPYYLSIKENPKDEKTQHVYLAKGTPIISRINNKKLNILNNDVFTITKVDKKNQTFSFIDNDDKEQTMKASEFSKMFLVAFCITLHASQGQTYNEPYTIWDWSILDDTSKYVGLTRSTDIKNITIQYYRN